MIILIIAIVATLIAILFILIAILKDETMFYLGTVIFGTSAIILYFMLLISSRIDNVDKNKYISLSMAAKHWDELSITEQISVGQEIELWNEQLNFHNDYWWRFSIEDRSQYIITIESNNKN